MRGLLCLGLACAAGLPSDSSAQTLRTFTDVGLFAVDGARIDVDGIAAGTEITGATSAMAFLGREAHAYIDARPVPGGFDIIESGSVAAFGGAVAPTAGTTQATGPGPVTPALHSYLLTAPAAPTAQELLVDFLAFWPGSQLTISVDIGNDGVLEWTAAATGQLQRQLLRLPSGGADVRVDFDGFADLAAGSYTSNTQLRVRDAGEQPCSITEYGLGCGPALRGSDTILGGTTHQFTMTLQNGPALAPMIWAFGAQSTSAPLPLSSCRLLIVPALVVPGTTDARGAATLQWQSGTLLGRWFAQTVVLAEAAPAQLTSSRGLRFDCAF
ncbi:MAG: hypothetical protein AAF628_05330 [Planctomycetota bacterium]